MTNRFCAAIFVAVVLASHALAFETINGFIIRTKDVKASIRFERVKLDYADLIEEIHYSLKGEKHKAHAVPLLTMLKRACGIETEVKSNSKTDLQAANQPLRMAITVSSRNDTAAVFGLGEMLPEIGGHSVWIAIDQDGSDLSRDDGPMELIVPDDVTPGRWIRAINYIDVQEMPIPFARQ